MREIIFSYNKERCHAKIVDKKPETLKEKFYVGNIDGYEIYKTGVLFNQFGFIAFKKEV